MSFRASLSEASAGVLSLCLGAIGGVLGLIAVAVQAEWVSVPIGVAIGVFVALLIGYHNVRRARDAAESRLKELLEPRAELRYRAAQVRYGTLAAGDEYRHVVDVVNLSRRALAGCRLVLESSEPDEAHVTYPNSALGDRIGNKDGVFVLNPGNGDTPTFRLMCFRSSFRLTTSGARQGRAKYAISTPIRLSITQGNSSEAKNKRM